MTAVPDVAAAEAEIDASQPLNERLSRLAFWAIIVFVLAYCGTLLGAMSVQIFGHERPCPLCMLQRYAMILATIPALWIAADALRGRLTRSRYAAGLGMSILASVAGAMESTRQILLHIASKTDPGYGSAVLGLHLYTWALITFVVVIVFCGAILLLNPTVVPLAPSDRRLRGIARGVLWLFLGVIVINVLLIVALEGFSWVLPDDPSNYRLFHELGVG
jgi:disulfide bond formation protein DsbB